MKVYDEMKNKLLTGYDLDKGRLKPDRILVAHHKACAAIEGVGHYETIKEYANGGKDVCWVWDTEPAPAKEAWDEYEDIYVFIPYTEAELTERRERHYKASIVSKIRQRYTLDDELALARQRDTKPDEWAAYNAYCEACKAESRGN